MGLGAGVGSLRTFCSLIRCKLDPMKRHLFVSALFVALLLAFGHRYVGRTVLAPASSSKAVPDTLEASAESDPSPATTLVNAPARLDETAATNPPQEDALAALPQSEQESLWSAFREARHAVDAITPAQAALPQNQGVRYFASNPGQQITARFLDGAVRVESGQGGSWAGTVKMAGGTNPMPVAEGSRVEFSHGNGTTEWYENRPEGIEQGFTLARRPADGTAEEIRIDVELAGLEARFADAEKTAVEFVDGESGTAVLRYEKLKVWDATGRILESRFDVEKTGVGLLVADAGAVYPVTIDPLIVSPQEAKLEAGDPAAGDLTGYSVALAGDTALIGAIYKYSTGAAYVFTRSGSLWALQAKLTADDGEVGDEFGYSVALSVDTALVGARRASISGNPGVGCAYLFTRNEGGGWEQTSKLTASDGAEEDKFGTSVALSGSTALVGAPDDGFSIEGTPAFFVGSAYVFTRDSDGGWTQKQKLIAGDGADYESFGCSVALDGNTALIGAFFDEYQGAAYVFTGSGASWTQQAKLTADDGDLFDNFGQSVALSGTNALIGAPGDDSSKGSAYFYVGSGASWTQHAKLTAGDGAENDFFGNSVALIIRTALIGSPYDDTGAGLDAGSAYVFTRTEEAWSEQAKLTAGDGSEFDNFGSSVALSGNTALIGAPVDDTDAGLDAGTASVFTGSGAAWTEQALLTLGDGASFDQFGESVSLSGDTALIGVRNDDIAGSNDVGSAYVFTRSRGTWTRQAKLIADDGEAYDQFGYSVSLDGDTALIGAAAEGPTFSEGSAYIFTRSGAVWTQQANFAAEDGADDDYFGSSVALSGGTALIGAFGLESAYVFTGSGVSWTSQAKLTPSDGESDDKFGISVSLSGDTALVGAPWNEFKGAAYVYTRSGGTWAEGAKLTASDGESLDQFGGSVALSGATALIGASAKDGYTGGAYVFTGSGPTWTEQAKLAAEDGVTFDYFGNSVALLDDTALVGAFGKDSQTGSAYVFTRRGTTWTQKTILTASDGETGDQFGNSLALSGDTALIGAFQDDTTTLSDSGGAYVFRLFKTGPEIRIDGNGTEISDGDSTPSISDDTAFGSTPVTGGILTRTFTIRNTGFGALNLAGTSKVAVSGDHASEFTVTTEPGSSVASSGNTTFTVTFNPSALGLRTAILSIESNDTEISTYDFAISGTGSLDGLTHQYTGADNVPASGPGVILSGTATLTLGYVPIAGTTLTVVQDTGLGFIDGTFGNLTQGQVLNLTFGGNTFPFVVNYYGGTGNDLVLQWAGTKAMAWGGNGEGQLGKGDSGFDTHSTVPNDVLSTGVLSGKTLITVAAGQYHSLALCSDGTVAAWGDNEYGQLGKGDSGEPLPSVAEPSPVALTTDSTVPVAVSVADPSAIEEKTVIAIAAGQYHSLALCSDGTVAAWGNNDYGQLGDGTNTSRDEPVAVNVAGTALEGKTVVAIAAGESHSLALCSDGTVVAWGYNLGQLGDGTYFDRNEPVALDVVETALEGRSVIAIAAGQYHSLALCSDGTVVAWGVNSNGQLGTGNNDGTTNAVAVRVEGTPLEEDTVIAIAAGHSHSLALLSDGTVTAWGFNLYGQLGNDTSGDADSNEPVAVSVAGTALSDKTVIAIAAGHDHSLALCSDGTLAAWGNNEVGTLGDNSTTNRDVPVAVNHPAPVGSRFVAVAKGSVSYHSLGLLASPIPVPEIIIYGEKSEIPDGDTTPSADDLTLFGSTGAARIREFDIINAGTGDLTLGGTPIVALSGSAAFSVTTQPESATMSPRSSSRFKITFDPDLLAGVQTATVTIANNDADEGPYTFTIQGVGLPKLTRNSFRIERGDRPRSLAGLLVPGLSGGAFSGTGVVNGAFNPGNLPSGDYLLTYTTQDALGEDLSITLTATVTAEPKLSIDRPKPFDETQIRRTSRQQTFVIENTGGSEATGLQVRLRGGGAKHFKVVSQPARSLRAKGKTQFRVVFFPLKAGPVEAKLEVSAKGVPPLTVTISGRGKIPTGNVGHNPGSGNCSGKVRNAEGASRPGNPFEFRLGAFDTLRCPVSESLKSSVPKPRRESSS